MKGYLMKVICAALVCSLAQTIGGDGPGKAMRKMVSGMFLVLAVISPLGNLELPRLELDALHRQAEAVTVQGAGMAERERRNVITESCEAYIWNKAAEMELEIQVLVELDEGGLPCRVELSGQASPLERQELTETLVRELGVGKEDVIWIPSYQSSE